MKMRRAILVSVITALAALLAGPLGFSQGKPAKSQQKRSGSLSPEAQPTRVVRYNSLNRRDPFLDPSSVKRRETVDEEVDRGAPPPGIAGMYIAQVRLQGVSSREDGRTAVFRGTDNRAYFLQTGDKFFDGYLKSIREDAVVMVREKTFRSGKTVTDEVTQRLRTP